MERTVSCLTTTEWINTSDNVDIDGMSIYWQTDNICFKEDNNAKITLYVAAEKNDDGEFSFDDGQEWLLIMETSFGSYPLFPRRYVQLGRVEYSAFNGDSGVAYDVFHVIVTVRQSAGFEIYECVFDNARKAFKKIPVYNASNINLVGGSQ